MSRVRSQHKSKKKRINNEVPSEGTVPTSLKRERSRQDKRRHSVGSELERGKGRGSEEPAALSSPQQRQRRLSGARPQHPDQRQRRLSNAKGELTNQQHHMTADKDQLPKGRRFSEGNDTGPQGRRRQSVQQDQSPGEHYRRLSGGQEDNVARAQPQQRRLSAEQGGRRLSVGQNEHRSSAEEEGKRLISHDKHVRPEVGPSEGTGQNVRPSTDENVQEKTNEVQRTLSDELAEKLVRERENASFKSHQTIMRRRKRRNPYANEYERHYVTGAKVKQRHKQRRIKGM